MPDETENTEQRERPPHWVQCKACGKAVELPCRQFAPDNECAKPEDCAQLDDAA